MTTLLDLPDEILLNILQRVILLESKYAEKTIVFGPFPLLGVCTRVRGLALDRTLWREVFLCPRDAIIVANASSEVREIVIRVEPRIPYEDGGLEEILGEAFREAEARGFVVDALRGRVTKLLWGVKETFQAGKSFDFGEHSRRALDLCAPSLVHLQLSSVNFRPNEALVDRILSLPCLEMLHIRCALLSDKEYQALSRAHVSLLWKPSLWYLQLRILRPRVTGTVTLPWVIAPDEVTGHVSSLREIVTELTAFTRQGALPRDVFPDLETFHGRVEPEELCETTLFGAEDKVPPKLRTLKLTGTRLAFTYPMLEDLNIRELVAAETPFEAHQTPRLETLTVGYRDAEACPREWILGMFRALPTLRTFRQERAPVLSTSAVWNLPSDIPGVPELHGATGAPAGTMAAVAGAAAAGAAAGAGVAMVVEGLEVRFVPAGANRRDLVITRAP